MTRLAPDELTRAGMLLFGSRWKTDLARALGISPRRVTEWLSGERSIPASLRPRIADLMRRHQLECASLLRELESASARSTAVTAARAAS